jgi:hypothetical protein
MSLWYRPVMLGATIVLLVIAAVQAVLLYRTFDTYAAVGIDYDSWLVFADRFVSGGGFYHPDQLAGPYETTTAWVRYPPDVPALYPPPYLLFAVGLTVVPSFLYWAAPLGLLGYVIASWRPAPWTWPVMALLACASHVASVVIVGGTTMWVAALFAAGIRWGWPAVLIFLKPTFAPLALVGVRHRSWWVAAVALALVSLAMLPLWFDYLTAMRNATDASLLYSLGDAPWALIPAVAWLGATRAVAPGGWSWSLLGRRREVGPALPQ